MVGEVSVGKDGGATMKSFITGTLIGAALGAVTMYMWVSPGDESPAETVVWEKPEAVKKEGQQPSAPEEPKRKLSPFDVAETPPTSTQRDATASIPNSAVTSPTTLPASGTKPLTDSNIAVADPIRMTEAHREMLTTIRENGRLTGEKHLALEQEARDESWSHYMEQMLGSYLSTRAPQAGVEIVNIVCRTTACEIQAFDNHGPNALTGLLGQATKETWWEFSSMDAQASDYGTRTRTLIFLGRHMKAQGSKKKLIA
jgi:hypothetical protein